ncbi:hypothetical protein LDDCCGHA_2204 [Methylobacterium oxalidis]|nr:hypothetical protein LDDCCGHA_2204 [Methylobacterium oxalidis]
MPDELREARSGEAPDLETCFATGLSVTRRGGRSERCSRYPPTRIERVPQRGLAEEHRPSARPGRTSVRLPQKSRSRSRRQRRRRRRNREEGRSPAQLQSVVNCIACGRGAAPGPAIPWQSWHARSACGSAFATGPCEPTGRHVSSFRCDFQSRLSRWRALPMTASRRSLGLIEWPEGVHRCRAGFDRRRNGGVRASAGLSGRLGSAGIVRVNPSRATFNRVRNVGASAAPEYRTTCGERVMSTRGPVHMSEPYWNGAVIVRVASPRLWQPTACSVQKSTIADFEPGRRRL